MAVGEMRGCMGRGGAVQGERLAALPRVPGWRQVDAEFGQVRPLLLQRPVVRLQPQFAAPQGSQVRMQPLRRIVEAGFHRKA